MTRAHIKEHEFVGEVGTQAIDGFFGFRLNQRYKLRYTRQDAGVVIIELDHLPYNRQLYVTAAEFERWFRK